MIKLKYSQVQRITSDMQLMKKLIETKLPAKAAYNLKRIFDSIGVVHRNINQEYLGEREKVQKQFCVVDENGNLKAGEDHQLQVLEGKDMEFATAMHALEREFGRREVAIDRNPLALSFFLDAPGLELSLDELDKLEAICTDMAEVKPEAGAEPTSA